MGRFSSEVSSKTRDTTRRLEKSKEIGASVVSEVGKKASILDTLPQDVDEEVLAIRQAIREKVKEAGKNVMDTKARSELEAGQKLLQESSSIAQDQINKESTIIESLHKMESSGDLGAQSIREGIRTTEISKRGFESSKETNSRLNYEASNDFQKKLSEL